MIKPIYKNSREISKRQK